MNIPKNQLESLSGLQSQNASPVVGFNPIEDICVIFYTIALQFVEG